MSETSPPEEIVAQHTPGPWTAHDTHDNASEIHSDNIEGRVVATVHPRLSWYSRTADATTDPVQQANARLIAAAPTMFSYIEARANDGDAEARAIVEAVSGHA